MRLSNRRLPLALLYPEVTMDHVSTLVLYQLRSGELDAETEATVRAHMSSCARCQARLRQIENARAAFELEPMPPSIQRLAARPHRQSRLVQLLRSPVLLMGLAAAAALLLLVLPAGEDRPPERRKGSVRAEVLVEGLGVLSEGQSIQPGDRLQLRVPPGDWEQVWLGDGEALLATYPMSPSQKWELIPIALEVDSDGDSEHIVLVLSNHSLTEEEAEHAVAGDALGGVQVQEWLLPKEK